MFLYNKCYLRENVFRDSINVFAASFSAYGSIHASNFICADDQNIFLLCLHTYFLNLQCRRDGILQDMRYYTGKTFIGTKTSQVVLSLSLFQKLKLALQHLSFRDCVIESNIENIVKLPSYLPLVQTSKINLKAYL